MLHKGKKKFLKIKTNLKIYFLSVILEENQNRDIKKKIFKNKVYSEIY